MKRTALVITLLLCGTPALADPPSLSHLRAEARAIYGRNVVVQVNRIGPPADGYRTSLRSGSCPEVTIDVVAPDRATGLAALDGALRELAAPK